MVLDRGDKIRPRQEKSGQREGGKEVDGGVKPPHSGSVI